MPGKADEGDEIKRLFMTALLVCAASAAQTAGYSKPATTNVPSAEYPRAHLDLRVTCQLKAPGRSLGRVPSRCEASKVMCFTSCGKTLLVPE